eukprot:TRINITY_DN108867_c0_g1_i1.p1 TRINITY_DN108867_c0_g1~~TRINITY_DN108867_c0_g1_i1.p1  ORF type:complete len:304 (-),score=72.46 TRINITY_DN108867_c0_g1_i1:101-1012(-)
MDKRMESQDDEEHTGLVSSSEDSGIGVSPWPKVRYMTAGLALFGIVVFAAVSGKSGPTFRSGGLKNSMQLDDTSSASNFYLVKQTFKSDDDIKPFWEAWNNMSAGTREQFIHDGYHIPTCMMLARKGPFFHVLEQKVGNSDDAQTFFDKWVEDTLNAEMLNEMMPLAFPPMTPFFQAEDGVSSRRLADGKLDVGFYLVELAKDKDDADKYSKNFAKAGGFKKWNQDAEEEGDFHDHMCIAVKGGELSYELVEAKPGVTSAELKEYASKWIGENVHVEVGVHVWPIPKELNGGGAAGMGVTPYF